MKKWLLPILCIQTIVAQRVNFSMANYLQQPVSVKLCQKDNESEWTIVQNWLIAPEHNHPYCEFCKKGDPSTIYADVNLDEHKLYQLAVEVDNRYKSMLIPSGKSNIVLVTSSYGINLIDTDDISE